ncbi:BPSL0067 family protein [Nitrospirillum iridis]|uniref:Peptidase C51 domain-containing protein n=1 Tax=Nitrospirillum iridis TaxID=765888 RepID=A0A7X0B045_9PROT|nr:BPSL0067 family protein [Nitrospirillum iridis]MBB6251724.1 hypothetical protein [Nitrospirillum iridis]
MSPQRSTEFWPGTVHRADACFDGAPPKDGLPYVNDQGAFLGGGLPLLRRVGEGWQPQTPDRLAATLTQAYGRPYTLDDGVRLAQRLASVAQALSEGKRALAAIALVRVGLPPAEGATKAALAKAANDAYQGEARDDQGRWVADGFAGLSTKQVDAKVTGLIAEAGKVGGWFHSAPHIDAQNIHECVSLVRSLTSGLAKSGNWREGEKLTPDVIKTLKPGTVIATFDPNGRYGNRAAGNHAAIFLSATDEGIWVLEQYNSRGNNSGQVHKKLYLYGDKRGGSKLPTSYSTIKKD